MPDTQFSTLTLLNNRAGLTVTGPYDPKLSGNQSVVGDAFIGFLVIQNDNNGNPTQIVDGVATWTYAPPDPVTGKYADWTKTVSVDKAPNFHTGDVRAIGTAVQVTDPGDNYKNPPVVQTVTWCVPFQVKPE